METLEELKNTFKKLQEESNNLYNKIRALENQDKISKFTVGECYLDTRQDNLIKIVSIQDNYVYYICLDNLSICRENSCIYQFLSNTVDFLTYYEICSKSDWDSAIDRLNMWFKDASLKIKEL